MPHKGQLLIHRSKQRRRALACGTRFGKSTCASMEIVARLLDPRGGTLGWICAPTYEDSEMVADARRLTRGLWNGHAPMKPTASSPEACLSRSSQGATGWPGGYGHPRRGHIFDLPRDKSDCFATFLRPPPTRPNALDGTGKGGRYLQGEDGG